MRRAHMMAMVFVAALVAAGCPKGKSFDPRSAPEVPTSGDPQARTRFERARAMFERDEVEAARREFDAIAREFPEDPIAAHATLYSGMAAFRRGEHAEAAKLLGPIADDAAVDEDVRRRARFYLGLSFAVLGRHAEARALLEPFHGKVTGGEDEGELYAALAESAAGQGDAEAALRYYDEWFARARPAEKLYIAARVRDLVDALPEPAVRSAYGRADKRLVAAAFLGRRLAVILRAGGDAGGAREVLAETEQARLAAGLVDESAAGGRADPQLVGALLPLTGKGRLVGEALLRGLAMAAGTFGGGAADGGGAAGGTAPFRVTIRDAGGAPEAAAGALDDLVAEGVIAVVGPIDREAAEAAARRAEAAGVTLVTLDVAGAQVSSGSPHVFRIVPSVESRARALARHAWAAGARDFAILAPEMTYGTRGAKAFRAEVERLGGHIVAESTYAKDATSFVQPVKAIAGKPWDALFVPDSAARLELIAPQLAASNLVVGPFGQKKPRRGRAVVLLSLAEALAPKFLPGAGRYANGAVLAPGFYPDAADPRIGAFVTQFRAVYGSDPTYLDAYAYDAALVVRVAVEAGARDRDAVAAAMSGAAVPGLTGEIRFGDDRTRADDGVLYTVTRAAGGGDAYEIHALRR